MRERERTKRERKRKREEMGGHENILKRDGVIRLGVDGCYGIKIIDDQNLQQCHINGRETTFHELILYITWFHMYT
jgi:hypothetical protein